MKLIFEIRRHGDEDQAHHLSFRSFPVTVGRAFDNDVILNDPYADAHHLQIEYDGDTCIVSDLGSENGFAINGKMPAGRRAHIKPGDALLVGHTEIRIYTPDFAVPPPVPLQKSHSILAWISRPFSVWIAFAAAMAVMLGWGYLEIWSTEPGQTAAGVAAGMVGILVIWSAAWAVAGRLVRSRANFKSHIGLMSLYMIAAVIAWYVEAYVDFLSNENWFSRLVTYGTNFAILALLIYGSLTLATRMPHPRRRFSAVFFSFGVMAGIFAFSLISTKNFNQQPVYPYTLEPFLSQLAPAVSVDNFMVENDEMFDSDEFTATTAAAPDSAKK